MEPADVLEQAADLLESGQVPWNQYGMLKGQDWHPHGACALEVMSKVGGPREVYYLARFQLAEHLAKTHGWTLGVGSWNDARERTLGEVVDAMKQTAKGLRNGAS